MTTLHAPNGHQDTAGGPQKVDRGRRAGGRACGGRSPARRRSWSTTYGDRVYRLAIRITGNEQDAEEVVQDALWTAARKIDTFKGESAFGSWVYRITANAAYQKLRSRHGQRNEISWDALHAGFDELRPARGAAARLVGRVPRSRRSRRELRKLLTTAIDDLPGDYRTAFLLHDVEGLSNPEIAETLHISLPAVKSRVHRSRLFLRQRLGRLHADGLRAPKAPSELDLRAERCGQIGASTRSATHELVTRDRKVVGMEAVIATGGKQYRVAPGQVIKVERLGKDKGAAVEFTQVLLVNQDGAGDGRPEGAQVGQGHRRGGGRAARRARSWS